MKLLSTLIVASMASFANAICDVDACKDCHTECFRSCQIPPVAGGCTAKYAAFRLPFRSRSIADNSTTGAVGHVFAYSFKKEAI